MAFNLSATTVYDPLDRSEDFENVEDIEFSAVLGAGCDLAVGQVALILDVRYNLGLSDIVEDSRNYNLENRSWQFTVGLGF